MKVPRLLARALRPASRSLVAALALLLLALALPRWNLAEDAWDTIVVFDIHALRDVEHHDRVPGVLGQVPARQGQGQ